ncbi:hypothetical protein GCM10010492_59850 [Saccharothrix mutabilis subsp. mutabilis]|uniref:Nucleic acid/nucleotide deaminase of polymorphic system toxin n=1 Tax=Saccharothrix mutabilis subsp. mutabilis TaxID=66855 RepID=A0ABN0UI54_9PSEU
MASIGEVVAALKAAVDQLPFAALADALDLAEEASALIEQVATGSNQDEFRHVLGWFEKATEGITGLQQRLTVVQQAATAAINRLERRDDPQAGVPRSTPPSTGPAAAGPVADGPPKEAQDLLKALPVRTDPTEKTSGFWVDASGTVHGPIHSGRGELREQAVMGLRELGLAPARGTPAVADHVEVQVAIQVREASGADATLAVNNRPCDAGPLSCDRIVPRVLKPGQRLTVHWPGGRKT